MKNYRIGVIGTGIMGTPIASNLLAAGHALWVYTRTKAKAEKLLEAGASWASSPGQVASEVDIILTVVSDSPDVEAVYLGPDGVCSQLKPDSLCIDMSTIDPETAKRVGLCVQQSGGGFLDAPVSGGKNGAEAGTLSIMVGGDEADVARARPIFDAIGKTVVHCGPIGHGQLTKLCNQVICGLNLLAISEALTLAGKAGLDPSIMLEAVSKGAAGSWAVDNLGTRMATRDFEPMFMIDLQQKDLRHALDTARSLGLPLPGSSLVHQLLTANQAAGEGREGTQALVKTIERLASFTVTSP